MALMKSAIPYTLLLCGLATSPLRSGVDFSILESTWVKVTFTNEIYPEEVFWLLFWQNRIFSDQLLAPVCHFSQGASIQEARLLWDLMWRGGQGCVEAVGRDAIIELDPSAPTPQLIPHGLRGSRLTSSLKSLTHINMSKIVVILVSMLCGSVIQQ